MVYIPRELVEQMVQHAVAGLPNEACGMLAGRGERAIKFYPATNVEASAVRYLMDPRDQLHIMQDMESNRWDLLGIFHSHTGSPAYPSQTDVSLAYYPDALYLIASLMDQSNPVLRAYRIVDGQISEEMIEEPPD